MPTLRLRQLGTHPSPPLSPNSHDSPLRTDPAPPKTRHDLEWDRVLAALADRCFTAMGRADARALPFSTTRDEARTLLAEAQEACALHAKGEALPIESLPDVREAVSRLRVGGVLGPAELRTLAQVLGAARSLRRFLSARRASAPALFASCSTDPTLDRLADEIARELRGADGSLTDRASPRLRELRDEQQASRQRMVRRLEELMSKYEGILQDHFITEREGRWVVPVRSDAHERFPGIVHSTSSSGSTLFVEPRAVIPMGNRLKVLEAEVQREEIAVYTRLSSLLVEGRCRASRRRSRPSRGRTCARRRRAWRTAIWRCSSRRSPTHPRLELRAARHPLSSRSTALATRGSPAGAVVPERSRPREPARRWW